MQFALQVPGRGAVAGSLLYYPFENEAETLPLEDPGAGHAHITTYNLTQVKRDTLADRRCSVCDDIIANQSMHAQAPWWLMSGFRTR